jgi:hypothetical protein
MSLLVFWIVKSCGLVDTNVSEKHTVSIFSSAVKMETVCFSETLAYIYNYTRRYNPD